MADHDDLSVIDESRPGRARIAARARLLLLRSEWPWLTAWSALLVAVRLPLRGSISWKYFDEAAALTFGAQRLHGRVVGLHIYTVRPGDQFGPLAIVVAEVFRELGGARVVLLVHLALLTLGLATLWLVISATRDPVTGTSPASLEFRLVAGAAFLWEWNHLALESLHIDDAIALACAAIAVRAIARRSAWWIPAVAIGAAAAAKPWAIVFLPLLVAAPIGRRRVGAALAAAIGIGVWAPFVIGASNTLAAARYTIANAPSSVLRLLGVHNPRTPSWDRPVQLLVGAALGMMAALQDNWPGVIVVAISVRIALDPSVRDYYTTGLVFGALVWELFRPRWRWPVLTVGVGLLLDLPQHVAMSPSAAAALRLLACLACLYAVFGDSIRAHVSRGLPRSRVLRLPRERT